MKVWIVEECFDYEGCSIIAVFDNEQSAKDLEKTDSDYSISEWDVKTIGNNLPRNNN